VFCAGITLGRYETVLLNNQHCLDKFRTTFKSSVLKNKETNRTIDKSGVVLGGRNAPGQQKFQQRLADEATDEAQEREVTAMR